MERESVREMVGGFVYLVLASAWIYLDFDRSTSSSYGGPSAVGVALLGLSSFATGLFVGRWWAILLALPLVPISIPAGYTLGEGPVWAYILLIYVPFAGIALGLGIAARKIYGVRRNRRNRIQTT